MSARVTKSIEFKHFRRELLRLSRICIKFLKIGTLKPTSKRFQTGGEKNNQEKA